MENVWRIKKIGQYTCYKASYIKQEEEKVFSFGNWNQTNGTNQPKKPKKMRDVEVVAWFTPEIPVSSGPSWYQGLPGLILEVSDDDTTILCTKIVMNPKEKTKIKRPKKEKLFPIKISLYFKMKKEQKDLKCGDNQGKEDNHRLPDFDK